ncbi:MAG TPA: sulfatase-like hydrolase/transferase [Pirellula sp.]|nr:sulfatase-like hydrolase/transferase [Pirellula sp.]
MVGKWDMGQAKRYLPLQRGFDFFYGHGNNGIDYYTHERYGIPSMFRGNKRTPEDRGSYATDIFKREALAFIRMNTNKPWFLYVPFNAPHGASSFAPGSEKKSGMKLKGNVGVQVPDNYVAPYLAKGIPESIARYYGAVTCMDEAVGALLDEIKASGRERDTLVMFQSDNGGSGNGDNAPLRGKKGTIFEGGLRVPFIARWPTRLPAGRVTDEFLTSLELLPTIATAAGATLPTVMLDGFDAMPVLAGEMASPREEMFWQRRNEIGARVGKWKWVATAKGGGLFDLATDLAEKKDLSRECPVELARVQARYNVWRQSMDSSEPRGPFRDD